MITGLLFILLVAVMGAALSAVFQNVARRRLDVVPFCALISLFQVSGALLGMRWDALRNADHHQLLALAGIMTVCGLCNGLGVMANIEAMKRGHAAISNALAQAALLIPFTFSILIWKEHASVLNLAGVAGVILMGFLLGPGGAPRAKEPGGVTVWLLLILLAFVGYGFAQLTYQVPSRWANNAGFLGLRPLFLMLSQATFFTIFAFVGRRPVTRAMVPAAIAGAAVGLSYLYAAALAADAMTAVNLAGIVYPLAIGGVIILFALYSRIVLHESYTARSWIGLAAGVAGIVLICIR